jgi:hypothetical protein
MEELPSRVQLCAGADKAKPVEDRVINICYDYFSLISSHEYDTEKT